MNTFTPLRRTRLLGRCAALAACGSLVLAPAVASAAELVHPDATRDVRSASLEGDDWQSAPRHRKADIRRIRIVHGEDRIVVRILTRAPLPRRNVGVVGAVRTAEHTYDLEYSRFFGRSALELTTTAGGRVHCPDLAARNDRSRRLVRITVPSSCVGDPAWIRAGVGTIVVQKQRYFVDDAWSEKVRSELRLSPRIERG